MNTVDEKEAKTAWENKKIEVMKKLEEDGETKADIEEQVEFEKKNFDALNKYRYFKEDSFDFTVRSVSFYSEQQVVLKACSVLIEKLENFVQNILKIDVETGAENDEPPAVTIMLSKDVPNFPSTVVNSYDIIMKNEDYTLGNILQHMVYQMFYMGEKTVIFCGFQKFHPHATESVLRVAYVKPITNDVLVDDLKKSALKGVEIIRKIQKGFGK
jgi:DNA-directed RNA polymerase subunit L